MIIWHDMGGSVDERFAQMQHLARTHVEIRGTCVSACTLFLGLPDVCVAPDARLGFHGPTTAIPGLPLPRKDWERITKEMGLEYPLALRQWFMEVARYHISDYVTLTGKQVIELGARECE